MKSVVDDSPDSTLRVARDSVLPAALEASTWKTPASEGWHLESVNEDPEPEVCAVEGGGGGGGEESNMIYDMRNKDDGDCSE